MRWKQPGTAMAFTTDYDERARDEVLYPSSDGKPLGETDAHVREILATLYMLRMRYAERDDAYVAADLFVYYEEGNPKAVFAPDVFVVFGVPKRERRKYKLWEEGVPPAFVLEVSSKGTWLEDAGTKRAIYEKLGVTEYFMLDPEGDYLDPPLQGFRRRGRELAALSPDERGGFVSEVLGLSLTLEDLRLVLTDLRTGERLLRPEEEHAALRAAEAARSEAEARARAAEEELALLRAELAKR